MADVMMKLGGFTFSIDTAAYQSLSRNSEYRWASQDRIGTNPALQNIGTGSETINLQGVVFAAHRGGTGQLDDMRREAAKRQPLILVDGRGLVHGRWVIERVEEEQSNFAQAGVARRQQFRLQLRKYDDGV
ncbi:phage tail protein [Marinobacter adhaerens]|uniref:phage tail protein n=1 Tax=Marinobacter adhaerens TaxID=1033846 RepID=UPI003D2CC747